MAQENCLARGLGWDYRDPGLGQAGLECTPALYLDPVTTLLPRMGTLRLLRV